MDKSLARAVVFAVPVVATRTTVKDSYTTIITTGGPAGGDDGYLEIVADNSARAFYHLI